MLKKGLILVTALMLLVMPTLALCETATLSYEDTNGQYSFLYPDTWTVLDKDNVANILAEAADNEVFVAAVQAAQVSIESADIVVILSQDALANLNLIRSDVGAEYTDDMMLETGASIMQERLINAPDTVFTLDPQMADFGENHAMLMTFDYTNANGNVTSCAQFYISVGTALYVLTLGAPQGTIDNYTTDVGFILGSAELQ